MKHLIFLSLLLFVSGCSSKRSAEEIAVHPEKAPPPTKSETKGEASIEGKELAAVDRDSSVIELEFVKTHHQLTKRSNTILNKWFMKKMKIQKAKILVWSDEDYPDDNTQLSASAVKLAEDRGVWLKREIEKKSSKIECEIFNMAKRPGWLSAFFKNSDATLKNELEQIGIRMSGGPAQGTVMKSKAFVLFRTK